MNRGKQRGAPDFWKPEALARLREPGCPVCLHGADQTRGDFFWFINENYYEAETIVELRRSYGFCPLHTRQLLRTRAGSVITTVYSYLTDHALSRLQEAQAILTKNSSDREARDRCRRASAVLRPQGVCRVCRSLQWGESYDIHAILRALPGEEVQAAYRESPGLCLPHFRQASLLEEGEWGLLSFLSGDMRRRLKTATVPDGSNGALLEQIKGLDRERSIRRRDGKYKASDLPAQETGPITLTLEQASWSPTFDQVRAALGEPGCPVCIACNQGLEDYYRWLAGQMKSIESSGVRWDLSWEVCPSHFWELYAAGYEEAASLIAGHAVREWIWKLDNLMAGLLQRPSDRFLPRLSKILPLWKDNLRRGGWRSLWRIGYLSQGTAGVLESPQHKLDRLRTIVFREDHCQACFHVRETTRRTLDLILRVIEDPSGKQAYDQGWGLCLRHCITAAGLAENPAALSELLKAQITHLRILEWELEEASRKMNWSVRYEPGGSEEGAWRRAAYQFCGV